MICSTSAIAVCCCTASSRSRVRRAISVSCGRVAERQPGTTLDAGPRLSVAASLADLPVLPPALEPRFIACPRPGRNILAVPPR
jgi:hypothetical protein